jgi:cysteinyl-tRNA synthetase
MLHKIAESIEMSFDIPDAEKQIAEDASMRLEAFVNALKFAVKHLDVIYDPFSKHTDIPVKSVVKHRGLLNRLRGRVHENFEKAQRQALLGVQKLNHFSTGDTEIQELVNGFVEASDSLAESVSKFLAALQHDFRTQNFRDTIISLVDQIRKEAQELENLVYDRIIDHIDTNILAKNWMKDTSDALKVDMKEHVPLIQQLFEERQKEINPDAFPANNEPTQSLNPGDATKVQYPDAMRKMTGPLGG